MCTTTILVLLVSFGLQSLTVYVIWLKESANLFLLPTREK